MKLIEMIRRVDRSENNSASADIDNFCYELGINENLGWVKKFDDRVKGYYLVKWYCTDSWVGLVVYYMDDEPVAISMQTGRKSSPEYTFVSKEAAEKVRAFILTLVEPVDRFSVLDHDEEFNEFYNVEFSGQLLTKDGFVGSRPCKVIDTHERGERGYISQKLTVEFEDGTKKDVKVSDFKIRCCFI